MFKRVLYVVMSLLTVSSNFLSVMPVAAVPAGSPQTTQSPSYNGNFSGNWSMGKMTDAQRLAAAIRAAVERAANKARGIVSAKAAPGPGSTPDYFGIYPNYANSPLPTIDVNGNVVAGTGIRKFVDSLPGLGGANANDLGQYISVAHPDTITYPGSDYYEIAAIQYTEKLHADLPPTILRGYIQLNYGTNSTTHLNNIAPDPVHYLGPTIVATRDRPVRIKFTNLLPTTASGGDIFLPVDTTLMGAGMGPLGGSENYTNNRAEIHLHGGVTPWVSDGTPHQWTTPTTQITNYPQGVSLQNVPDMPVAPGGSVTLYYTNQQSARLMFYHDHALGETRLNVYDGLAAGYVLSDNVESALIAGGTIPGTSVSVPAGTLPDLGIPLIIQDKTFVPNSTQLAAEDPTWDTTHWGGTGNLWFPHVYMPNQNPFDEEGANGIGRWDYGPWFFPAFTGLQIGPAPNPYYDPVGAPWEPPQIPGVPNISAVPEAFADTPLVNGTPYPTLTVDPKAYRFRILDAANDRFFNLSWFKAAPLTVGVTIQGSGYTSVPTVVISGGSVTGANVTALLGVVSINVTGGGSGYTEAPDVRIVGGGGGSVAATAVVVGGSVSSVIISNPGTKFTSVPNITIDAPLSGVTATATASLGLVSFNVSGGTVSSSGPVVNPTVTISGGGGSGAKAITSVLTDVAMVPAINDPSIPFPASWILPTDGGAVPSDILNSRVGGVPDPRTVGPNWLQIGTEGGFLPAATVIPPMPIGYQYNPRNIVIGNVDKHSLWLGPAERADVIVDFSAYAGQTLILYNDSPAPVPAPDSRNDYFTGDLDQTATGGAPTTVPGYGPNTRTIMQVRVSTNTATAYNATAISNALPAIFKATQPPIIIPESAYNAAYNATYPNNYVRIQDTIFAAPNGTKSLSAITITNPGTGYTSAPTVTIAGGGGTGATGTAVLSVNGSVTGFTIGSIGSGYVTKPTVNITGGNGTGAVADPIILNGMLAGMRLVSGGHNYTSAPNVTITGGGGTGANATALLSLGGIASINLTSGGSGYTGLPSILFTGGGGSGAAAVANFTGTITYDLQPKAIQELFTADYGRMNATLGVEIPFTNMNNQTTIPYGYIEPTTEYIEDSLTPLSPVAGDGTQLWKITHNGVDSHVMHFHLFNVQVVNRVGWDGAIRPPDANELGWKETVKMHPLEDCIVALRPVAPQLPFGLPDSVRPMDPTLPLGASSIFFSGIAPDGNMTTVVNALANFGWEYVWHCHLLGHEENDMMRPIDFHVTSNVPAAPVLSINTTGGTQLSWTDATPNITSNLGNPANEIGFDIYRTAGSGYVQVGTVPANHTTWLDGTANASQNYTYKVEAFNQAGAANSSALGATTLVKMSAPAIPTLTSPANLSTVNLSAAIPFVWGSVTNATSYRLQILNGASAVVVDIPGLISANVCLPGQILSSGNYTWKVSANGSGGTSAFSSNRTIVVPAATTAPTLISPANNSSAGVAAPIVLTWGSVSNATSYGLQVTIAGAFSPLINLTGLTSTNYTIPAANLTKGTTYTWQVNAIGAGGTSAWSTAFTLNILGRATVADFDGDGKTDLAVWRPSDGRWYIIYSGNGTDSAKQWGLSTDNITPMDFDGDGKTDTAVWRSSDGRWYTIYSSNGTFVAPQWGLSTDIPVLGDYDGDGKTDLAVYRPSTGFWYILSSNGTFIATQWGLSTDIPVPGDYDGDGKTDIAVWRPSDGRWYIRYSSNGTNSAQQWGLSTDIPVLGDFDGDAKTDVAVWRPSDGRWYILYSSNGAFVAPQWGLSTDIPLLGDFDGDGKTDIAVWRPSNGFWYILYSSNGAFVARQWGLSTDIPIMPHN